MKEFGTFLMHSYIMCKAFINQLYWETFLKLHTHYFEDKSYTIKLLLSTFNGIC